MPECVYRWDGIEWVPAGNTCPKGSVCNSPPDYPGVFLDERATGPCPDSPPIR